MDCLFCKIINQEMASKKILETNDLVAFYDINPQTPEHILIVPKKHIATLNETSEEDQFLLGAMVYSATSIAKEKKIAENGYRLVFNVNQHGGQTVNHIHLHLLGGRPMAWPPG